MPHGVPFLRRTARRVRAYTLGVTLIATLATAARPLAAQDPDGPARMARLQALLAPMGALAGDWEGEGRVTTGPGRPLVLRQTEEIRWGSGRTVLFIRGTGYSTEPASRDSVVFEAAAVAWADAPAGKVRMRAYRDGLEVEADIAIRGDTIEWGFPVPGGRVQYLMVVTADRWQEVGHFLRDGGGRFPIVELDLRRRR
jgi:hypothetical protein